MDGFEVLPKTEKATDTDISDKIKIEPSEVQEYTIEFIYETTTADQSEDMGATLGGTLYIGEWVEKGILAKALFTTKYTEEELSKKREDFSKIVSEGSVYYEDKNWTEDVTKDNVGEKVYYFAGNAQDNWVQFGQDSTGKNLYWRIIRSNEDGGLRLLYAGTSPDTTEAYISAMAYNTSYDNTTYVGYMYSVGSTTLSAIRGNSTNSSIKAELDTWYATNLQSYDKYISKTAIYCNDRSNDNWSSSSTMYYGAAQRLTIQASSNKGASQSSQYHPSFKCGNTYEGKLHTDSESDTERKKDMFSYSTLSGGNGLLSKSVGGYKENQ